MFEPYGYKSYMVKAKRSLRDEDWQKYSKDRAEVIEFLHRFFHMRHHYRYSEHVRKAIRRRIDGIQKRKRELLQHPR